MNTVNSKWEEKGKRDRILLIISIALVVASGVSSILYILDVWNNYNVTPVLCFLFMVIQAVQYWKKDKKEAILFLFIAVLAVVTIVKRYMS